MKSNSLSTESASLLASILPPQYVQHPTIIAGPCSAESEEQTMETAHSLASLGVKIFRAGVWKPRTRPGQFEGVGTAALSWLARVKRETGMLVATEVANTKHVEAALRANIDLLWIGARTTVNTFAVQELASALRGTQKPIFVKNPVSPDLELWIGAFERLAHAGISKLAAVHRGFKLHGPAEYRNPPEWEIAVELRRRMPHLPLICDASHIAGKQALIMPVAQRALDLNYDGLMFESHCNPSQALSDAEQQLTPTDLHKLLQTLVLRHEAEPDALFQRRLTDLRQQIDAIDNSIVNLLTNRMKISEIIGALKKEAGVTILQTGRWEQILSQALRSGELGGLSSKFITKIFAAIHEESISHQNHVMNKRE